MEEPRRSRLDFEEAEMEMAAMGTHGGHRFEYRLTSRPAFMVSKAADDALWEKVKYIRPPMYNGNAVNLDRFLKKLEAWVMSVTEDMDPAAALNMSSNGSNGAYWRCFRSCTLWQPKREGT